eukprot:GHVH01012100.1.p1 GENE.GHVH01012100.1~~GHVH01012100.1.p1  ORF type:complete len:372 (+),score=59.00 GHVH01012100.1:55-1170(+)
MKSPFRAKKVEDNDEPTLLVSLSFLSSVPSLPEAGDDPTNSKGVPHIPKEVSLFGSFIEADSDFAVPRIGLEDDEDGRIIGASFLNSLSGRSCYQWDPKYNVDFDYAKLFSMSAQCEFSVAPGAVALLSHKFDKARPPNMRQGPLNEFVDKEANRFLYDATFDHWDKPFFAVRLVSASPAVVGRRNAAMNKMSFSVKVNVETLVENAEGEERLVVKETKKQSAMFMAMAFCPVDWVKIEKVIDIIDADHLDLASVLSVAQHETIGVPPNEKWDFFDVIEEIELLRDDPNVCQGSGVDSVDKFGRTRKPNISTCAYYKMMIKQDPETTPEPCIAAFRFVGFFTVPEESLDIGAGAALLHNHPYQNVCGSLFT